jgi:hypothetical protein
MFSLMNFTAKNQELLKQIPLYKVSTQGIRISFIDQLPTSPVLRRVHIMLASKFSTV